jgi:hypothetical protein
MPNLHGNKLANIVDPVVGLVLLHLYGVTVAVSYTACLHAGSAASFHVGRRIANHQAVFGTNLKDVD